MMHKLMALAVVSVLGTLLMSDAATAGHRQCCAPSYSTTVYYYPPTQVACRPGDYLCVPVPAQAAACATYPDGTVAYCNGSYRSRPAHAYAPAWRYGGYPRIGTRTEPPSFYSAGHAMRSVAGF